MNFDDFIKEGKVRSTEKNESLIKSIRDSAEGDLKFFKEIEIEEKSARKIVSNFYDILRSFLEAFALSKGYKIYSHEAFTSFLIKIGENDFAEKFDRFRRIRNKINYYGKDVSVEEAGEYIKEIKVLIKSVK